MWLIPTFLPVVRFPGLQCGCLVASIFLSAAVGLGIAVVIGIVGVTLKLLGVF